MAYFSATGTSGGQTNEPVLLWTNPSPNATFSAQKINIDLSNYEQIIIFAKGTSRTLASNSISSVYFLVNDDSTNYNLDGIYAYYGIDVSIPRQYKANRPVSISSTGVTFGNGTAGGSSGVYYCIPQKIYGLKKAII